MKTIKLFFLILVMCLSMPTFAQTRLLEVEPNHSTVGFRVDIAGFSVVTGKFTDYKIDVSIDENDITQSSFECVIQATSINTGIPDRDGHMRTADFFNVEQFPTIEFKSDSIHQINYSNFIAFGKFKMHGVEKQLDIPFSLVKADGNTIGFKIRLKLDRYDYGVGTSFVHTSMPDFLAREIDVEIDFWTRKRKEK